MLDLVTKLPCPVADHRQLTQRERNEHPDDVQLNERGHVRLRDQYSHDRQRGHHDDAVAVDQSITARMKLFREVPLLAQC